MGDGKLAEQWLQPTNPKMKEKQPCAVSRSAGLPYILAVLFPFGFDDIRIHTPDLLMSDHSPFWKNNIPALLISDSGNFRNPYYHTSADTIETLDFEFIEQITKATTLTALTL